MKDQQTGKWNPRDIDLFEFVKNMERTDEHDDHN